MVGGGVMRGRGGGVRGRLENTFLDDFVNFIECDSTVHILWGGGGGSFSRTFLRYLIANCPGYRVKSFKF
jgi:hypothetical protein